MTSRNIILPLSFVLGVLLIAIVSVAGTYLVTSSYDAAHPVVSEVTSISTVSVTQSQTSYTTQTQLSVQTVYAQGSGYLYGYGQSCYPSGCTTSSYEVSQCNAYRWLQTGQTCISGSLSYQGTCLLMYDYYDGVTYVLFGYGAPVSTPSGAYAMAVGYVLSVGYNPSPCGGIPFQVSYFLPA